MIQALIPAIAGLLTKVIDRAVPDKDQAAMLQAEAIKTLQQQEITELQGAIEIIKAEVGGESWLQRNWRPILMMWFAGLVGAHWLGFTPANLTQESINHLLDIVQLGIGGYVIGRSVEKGIREWKA